MNTKFLRQISQLLLKANYADLVKMDGNLPALSLGVDDGSTILSDHRQVIVIKKLVINVNMASGGGASVNVRT